MRKYRKAVIAAVLALLLTGGFLLQDSLVRLYVLLNDSSLDRFAQDALAGVEDQISTQYGRWDTAVWKENGIVEFCTQRSFAFGGIEKGFYYSKDDTPISFQATGYPLVEDGGGWTWTDPTGNHGYTKRIRPCWFWYEAVL